MPEPRPPLHESHRLGALHRLDLLDSEPEERFDRFVRLAQRVFDVPMAFVSLVDEERVWFKAAEGVSDPQVQRQGAFCDTTIRGEGVLVVENAEEDADFASSPMVLRGPKARFYAGAPLVLADGHSVGTLCIMDTRPRTFGSGEISLLQDLGALVASELRAIEQDGKDALTGLYGPHTFTSLARSLVAGCRRTGTRVSLLLLGLDSLPHINRTLGYARGDSAVRAFGEILASTVRDSDVVARITPATFAVLLPGCDGATSAQVIGRMGRRIRAFADTGPLPVDFSLGLATMEPSQTNPLQHLLDVAWRELRADQQVMDKSA